MNESKDRPAPDSPSTTCAPLEAWSGAGSPVSRRMALRASLRRIRGLLRKESLQIVRDPSSIAIALVMPVILLMLFGYGVSLDAHNVPVGVVLEDRSSDANDLAAHMLLSNTFRTSIYLVPAQAIEDFRTRKIEAILRVPVDFTRGLTTNQPPTVQLVVNGVDANRARLVEGYVSAVWRQWIVERAGGRMPPLTLESRIWFNADAQSRNFLVPGLVVLVMTLIGTLLTALVMAREWERGTMETLMVSPLRISELLLGKIIPYFVLGMGGMALCTCLAVFLFDVPLRGSLWLLVVVSAIFLLAALGMGLCISALARNQFVAGQTAILAAFLPAFFLSGFVFDLSSTPLAIQIISHAIVARYFAAELKTLFLAGDVYAVILPNAAALALLAALLLGAAWRRTRKRLD